MADMEQPHESDLSKKRAARLARLVEDAVDISDRFAREPVFARTGKGHYKSAGVDGLKEDIKRLKARQKHDQAE
jgi:hypothetical protein